MYCICCKKNNVHPELKVKFYQGVEQETSTEEDILWKKSKQGNGYSTIDSHPVNNGIIQIVSAGYGSNHDGLQVIIAICDNCITKNLEDSTLLFFNDYIINDEKWNNESIEKSKQSYRRRKNLDNLVN